MFVPLVIGTTMLLWAVVAVALVLELVQRYAVQAGVL